MTICKFFMQGNCRYGNNCWNEHPSGGNQGFSVSAQRQLFGGNKPGGQNFGQYRFKWISPDAQQQQQQQQQNRAGANQQLSAADTVKALSAEIQTMFEEGKMWPFTCIGFEKELPSLPGFNDISMEEMRMEAYEAQKSGNIQQFEQKFLSIVNEMMTQRQELKNPSMTVKQKLIGFIDDSKRKKNSSSSGQTSLFSGPSNSGLFGSGSNSSGPSNSGLFGSGSNSSGPSNSGLFGSGSSTSSTFGGKSSGGLFGSSSQSNSPVSGSLFGKKDQSSTSTFGQSGQQSVFGQSSTFGQTPAFGQSSTFGQSGQTGGTMFGQPTGQSTFGKTGTMFGQPSNQTLPTFGQPQTPKANPFGQNNSTTTQFQATTTTTTSFFSSSTPTQSSQTPFGSAVVPSGSSLGGSTTAPNPAVQAQPEDSAYTPIDKLTAEELAQFQSQTFTKVPLRPPPREFCF